MIVDKKTILLTAKLANLQISENEIDKYHTEFNKILGYVEKLDLLKTENIKPTSHLQDLSTPLRQDQPADGLSRDEALSNSPDKKEGKGKFFTVPKFID
jgi:aspartyl-tRNA(Asn)/glutamyl-tRNA(Gln) amidotransferase subunit C